MKFLKDFGALVAIVIAALGAAVTYGAMSQDVKAAGARLDKIEPSLQHTSTDTAVLQEAVKDIKQALDRIEDHLGTK